MLSREKGLHYEKRALEWLRGRGLKRVATNYHCRFGEIDLIMEDGATLCFIEVKYRSGRAFGGAAYSLTSAKQQRIKRAALDFLSHHAQYRHHSVRFDALFIEPGGTATMDQIEWIRNAFYAE